MLLGAFNYADFFPNSSNLKKLKAHQPSLTIEPQNAAFLGTPLNKNFDSYGFKGYTCSEQVIIPHYQVSERSLPTCREPAAFELMLDSTVKRGMKEGLAFADTLLLPILAGWGLRGARYGLRTCNCESRRRHWHSALQQLRHCHCQGY
ncbi:hypothetical protein [Vreelandella andesensis]|uniref:hypothetical protein n=1 Tax=Vreelandella andesensis TaxID=447567 RepID=UPI00142DFF96|nr:hypothetical protein [Halomonas andesensis]